MLHRRILLFFSALLALVILPVTASAENGTLPEGIDSGDTARMLVSAAIEAISKTAGTGQTGDGKIFVLDLQECVRIHTEERGGVAIG